MTQQPADKTALRALLRGQRRAYAQSAGVAAADVLARAVPALLQQGGIEPPAIVAAYEPLSDEIDPRLALRALRALGYRTALPVTQGRDAPLLFRAVDDQTPFTRSSFGVMEPASGDEVTPDVVLVPLLGFDADCQRLGYGAGHYDRTLALLRDAGEVFVAGLAFDMQRVTPCIGAEDHDQPLDCVVTDKGLYWPQS